MKISYRKLAAKLFVVLLPVFSLAQSNQEILATINNLSKDSSQVMHTVSVLSDVYGPRLLGTPKYYNSILWAEKTLKTWGINKIKKESFDRNYRGWDVDDFSIKMIEPTNSSIQTYPMAFTKSTDGMQIGEIVIVDSFSEVYSLKNNLKNKIVLLKGYYRPNKSIYNPIARVLTDEILNKASANPDPNDVIIGYHSRRSILDVFDFRKATKKARSEFFKFCDNEGVIAVIEPSNSPYGIIHADGNSSVPSFVKEMDIMPIPTFSMSNEHFGRLVRLKKLGYTPKLAVNLKTTFYDEPEYNVNLIADIPGTHPKLKDELIIIGAHLDSWHAGTGAVDNASSCAVVMEAMRLIVKSKLKPKRTVRMILWGGEEQVFAGSSVYIDNNVANLRTGEPEEEKNRISAYLNLDNGAGMIRGIYLMGNKKVEPYFSEYLQPFEKSQTLTLQYANQTDHELFDFVNVPGFQFIQDPLDYINMIHHTNMDVFEYVPEEATGYNAKLLAYLVYQIAQEKHLLPRRDYIFNTPNKEGNTIFGLDGFKNAKKVFLVGDFNQWNMIGTPLYKTDKGWETKIDLPKGKYYYKFIVDGYWTNDPKTPIEKLAKDGKGHGGLTIKYVN